MERKNPVFSAIETKFGIAAALALVTVIALCLAFYWTTREVRQSQRQVTTTYETIVTVGAILTKINEAETGQRGFILTDRPEFLQPYTTASTTIGADLRRLRELTRDNPDQQTTINRLEPLIRERLDRIREGLDLKRTKGFEAARQMVLTNRGNELMDEIRLLAHQIEGEAGASLTERYDRAEISSAKILLFFSILAAVNFSLLTFAYFLMRRESENRRVALETQSRLIQELEVANQDLKDFAYVVSHDLKAPLRGISSLAIFLNADYGDKLDAAGRENLQLLQNRVKRLHDLIEGILHYSRMARLQEEKRTVDVKRLLNQVIEMVAPPPNIRVQIGLMPKVEVEPTRLQQIFQNLIGNAVKFMDKPEGLVKVESTEEEKFWRFAVTDNGPGIDEKYHAKIFQLFQTLAPRDELENAGVGLSVVKKAVEACGGRIWIESTPGHGATFFFTIPKAS
jgi:signal transduction histidine kinase